MVKVKEPPFCFKKKCGINILYPHFANTYLMPFYASRSKILTGYGNVSIEEYNWSPNDLKGKLISYKNKEIVSIFYGTDELYQNATKSLGISNKIIEATFSLYVPRFIFLPFDLTLFNKFYKNKEFGKKKLEDFIQPLKAISENNGLKKLIPSFSDIKKEFRSYSGCNFFSDTIPQSEQIKKKIISLNVFGSQGDKVKILYYSASYSIYLFNLYPEYLPVYLDILDEPNNSEIIKFFKTNNYIYCKNKSNCNLSPNKCLIKKEIEQFHIEIFNDAKDVSNNLTDVFLDYVSKDFKKIPFHILQDVDCFSKAITLHHLYTSNDNKVKGITLRKLVEEYPDITDEDFNVCLREFKSTSKSLFFILILDYWTNKLSTFEFDDIDIFIPKLLLEKTFLSGRYYFIYKELFKLSFFYYNSTLPETNRINEVKISCPDITDFDIFSFYYDTILKDISKLKFQSEEKLLENIKIGFDFIDRMNNISNAKSEKKLNQSFNTIIDASYDRSVLSELNVIKKTIEKNVIENKYPIGINTKLRQIIEANTTSISKG